MHAQITSGQSFPLSETQIPSSDYVPVSRISYLSSTHRFYPEVPDTP